MPFLDLRQCPDGNLLHGIMDVLLADDANLHVGTQGHLAQKQAAPGLLVHKGQLAHQLHLAAFLRPVANPERRIHIIADINFGIDAETCLVKSFCQRHIIQLHDHVALHLCHNALVVQSAFHIKAVLNYLLHLAGNHHQRQGMIHDALAADNPAFIHHKAVRSQTAIHRHTVAKLVQGIHKILPHHIQGRIAIGQHQLYILIIHTGSQVVVQSRYLSPGIGSRQLIGAARMKNAVPGGKDVQGNPLILEAIHGKHGHSRSAHNGHPELLLQPAGQLLQIRIRMGKQQPGAMGLQLKITEL